jgi:hypothetical protein
MSTSLWAAALVEGWRGNAREDEVEKYLAEKERAEKARRMTGMKLRRLNGFRITVKQWQHKDKYARRPLATH